MLLQSFLLLVITAGAVLAFSFSRVRQSIVDDRLLFARTIAHYLDSTVSVALQDLGRLARDLPEVSADAAGSLRAFRFHSPFREAIYIMDARARIIAADPGSARPLSPQGFERHEAITPLVRKPGSEQRPVVAIVQPFRRGDQGYYLVAEMNPVASIVSTFLQDLEPGRETHITVIDENGIVIAAADQRQLFRAVPGADAYGGRIRAHRPLVTEGVESELGPDGHRGVDVLTVMVPLRFAPWGVVVEQHRATVFSGLYTTRRGLLLAGVLLALVGVLLTRALSKSIVVPIRQLSRQAETVRAGDLSHPITVSGDHEVEVLAQTLDGARQRLATTLLELKRLNEDLEGQVAARTRTIEARYLDLKLLLGVAQLASQERDTNLVVPGILSLVAAHYALPAVAMVVRPPGGPAATHVTPPEAEVPWLAAGAEAPADWDRRVIVYQGQLQAELFHPRLPDVDVEVMEALVHQLAISLHGAHLWKRAIEQDEQRQVLVRRLLSAAEEERRRLARELHDEIAQLLTVIQLSLDRVGVESPDLQKASHLLAETQREIHRIIHDLRPSLLDDLGLAAAMKAYADDHLVRQGLAVSLEIEEGLPARPEIEITVFRIYQELMTNVLRHAEAEHVSVELYERDGALVLAVEDDGRGFEPGEKFAGVGITGMKERAALVNGAIHFDSEPGMGTHVELRIPLG